MNRANDQENTVALKRTPGIILAGLGHPTRVNALIGRSLLSDEHAECMKLDALRAMERGPDLVSDLSDLQGSSGKPIWKRIVTETPFVAGTVPVYSARVSANKIDRNQLLDIAVEQMESGVGLLTIHATPTQELVRLSSKRLVPCTSRGGALVVRDILSRTQPCQNVYLEIIDELLPVAQHTGTVISLGTTFRPANIFDSLDEVHLREIALQRELAQRISRSGVGVVIEGPGHCRPSDIDRVASILRQARVPIMALGPIPIDSAIGIDHVAAAIGATLLGLHGCAHILSAVTREEHTGGVPSLDSLVEGVTSARIAAKIIDIELIGADREEWDTAALRATARSCIAGQTCPSCSRCGINCPLVGY